VPTATQASAPVHDTPSSSVLVAPLGLGVGWTDQVDPFQASAKVKTVEAYVYSPTATQEFAAVHDTALS
jgi:hypothetical protein